MSKDRDKLADEIPMLINLSHQAAELTRVHASDDEDLICVEFDGHPKVYGKVTDALLERGWTIAGITNNTSYDGTEKSYDGINLWLRPVTVTTETVEVDQLRVEMEK